MIDLFYEVLFAQHILVADPLQSDEYPFEAASPEKYPFETLAALASLFQIRITEGQALAQQQMIPFAASQLGRHVPEPFYRGFPKSVWKLSPDELLFDQALHYFATALKRSMLKVTPDMDVTIGMPHSILETMVERSALAENTQPKDFRIVTQDEALQLLCAMADNLLESTRPLNETQYDLVGHLVQDGHYHVSNCASKNTAILLTLTFRDVYYTKFLQLSDVHKLIDELLAHEYIATDTKTGETLAADPYTLNLRNKERKFITKLIHTLFDAGKADITTCFEQKQRWKGLLHHIHYKPRNAAEVAFVAGMRGKENHSVYAKLEHALAQKDVRGAALLLRKEKGSAAVLRKLNYLLHHCATQEDMAFVLAQAQSENFLVLLQLLTYYAQYGQQDAPRTFRFTAHNRLRIHTQTEEEHLAALPPLAPTQVALIRGFLQGNLAALLKNRLGKVYLSPAMRTIALPLQETTAQTGLGTLPKGSRLPLDATNKKVRAFTYWEKVKDIDLSVIALDDKWRQREFSWRTMSHNQSNYFTFSGDQTDGYKGGSEYFDINLAALRQNWPSYRYLVFCNNVFSGGKNFSDCLCKAGYMLRDKKDSGQVFEPKTVQSSFTINAEASFAYLFALDLATDEFIWLNLVVDRSVRVAGSTSLAFLAPYFITTDIINLYTFIEMMARELVTDPAEADLVVSDETLTLPEGVEQIHSYDVDKMLALMNIK